MKNLKSILPRLMSMIALVIFVLFPVASYAQTCAADRSPTGSCTDLSITSGGLSIVNNYSITPGASLSGILVSNTSGIVNITNSSTGTFQNFANSGYIGLLLNSVSAQITSLTFFSALQNGTGGIGASIQEIRNYGSIVGDSSGIVNNQPYSIANINNYSLIRGLGSNAINNSGSIGSINNIGTGSRIETTTVDGAIYNGISGTINSITNQGVISSGGGSQGIWNVGAITTLNNAQGNTNNALTYKGILPAYYNIIINGPINYGQLAVTSGTGSTTFGIYTGSTIRNGTYASVLSGVTSSNLTRTSGTIGSGTWLLSNGSGTIWDLIISGYYIGPSVANTNQSLVNTASALQGTYTLQNSVLANSFSYDCNVFGANDVCVSAGGRNTTVQAANGLINNSALLIAAYRPHPNYRIGAYADQNLSVSNPGGTVNLGNNTPLLGLFAAWNERLDGTGTEVKVSAAYGQKNTTITRSVVGSGDGASEAGTGSSKLNSQGVQATAKYGFAITDKAIVSPYVGVRYTQNNINGYTEATSSSVTAPLTYSALNTNATTALAGVGASYQVIPLVTTFASAGVETDTNTSNGTYSASNTSIGPLTPVNFNANPVRTRPTATLGAYYDIEKNQRVGITGIYRQEAYQAVSTTTVMATYTVGL